MTMKRKILLYYAPIIVTAMIIGSLYPYATSGSIILMILFLPEALLLWVAFFKVQKRNLSSDEQSKVLFNSKKNARTLTLFYFDFLNNFYRRFC